MSRVVLAVTEPLFRTDGCMAGLQIRTYEMARALARRGHRVTVAEFGQASPPGAHDGAGFDLVRASGEPRLAADVWIAHPFAVRRCRRRLGNVPLVVDGYESPFGSFLAHSAYLLPRLGPRVMYDYRATTVEFLRALQDADRVLCGTENQRICYLSLLAVIGKVNPKFESGGLVLQVPSGAPPEPPAGTEETRELTAARAPGGPAVLWVGGCYPWFDVDTYLAAMPLILDQVPNARFVFAGVDGVHSRNGGGQVHPAARRLLETVNASTALKAQSSFVDWLPYRQRGPFYAAAQVGVCTFGAHLETLWSMRVRMIDMMWAGVPLVATAGDPLGRDLEARGAAITVPAGDACRLADRVVALLRDPRRRDYMAASARAAAIGDLSWDNQVEPLHRFCLAPEFDPGCRDRLVARTAARIVRLNDGWRPRAGDRVRRVMWRAARAAASWRD